MNKPLDYPIILTEEKMNELIKEIASSIVCAKYNSEHIVPSKSYPGASTYTKEGQDSINAIQLEWRHHLTEFFELNSLIKPITYPKI